MHQEDDRLEEELEDYFMAFHDNGTELPVETAVAEFVRRLDVGEGKDTGLPAKFMTACATRKA